jgi:hypothetical protein
MLIGLSGYAQSGKDTFANILIEKHGFKRLAFADKIREFLLALDDSGLLETEVRTFGWDAVKQDPDIRGALQALGIAARKTFGEYFWVDQVMAQVLNDGSNYVITDVRFPNELEAIRSAGGKVGRITRMGVNAVNGHESEHALANAQFDFYIENDGEIKDLEDAAEYGMREWVK